MCFKKVVLTVHISVLTYNWSFIYFHFIHAVLISRFLVVIIPCICTVTLLIQCILYVHRRKNIGGSNTVSQCQPLLLRRQDSSLVQTDRLDYFISPKYINTIW